LDGTISRERRCKLPEADPTQMFPSLVSWRIFFMSLGCDSHDFLDAINLIQMHGSCQTSLPQTLHSLCFTDACSPHSWINAGHCAFEEQIEPGCVSCQNGFAEREEESIIG
jgi:hypothetical protein